MNKSKIAALFLLSCAASAHAISFIIPTGKFKNAGGVVIELSPDRTAKFSAVGHCMIDGKLKNTSKGILLQATKRTGRCPVLLGAYAGVVSSIDDTTLEWRGVAQSLKMYNGQFTRVAN